jgi:hypothetical protein
MDFPPARAPIPPAQGRIILEDAAVGGIGANPARAEADLVFLSFPIVVLH